eukprot:CAMPEP_0118689484 /NCGR_PEP_ID=MMETSP0800-20121206/9518_1 /TAXON_ID=210618 ORGANISM="Striatella unipunctata, Strain CCMP2910" /NCGR_SAMPLE_ID=MMETSP0800 /ASSEMBLY_ACC=CAM_ASM_000638 /LENGTH=1395 /DNA_ID=CAMNT_0006586893 /DNA_START=212 /DNA_END=4399 /DNA_ORIENTATION=-
MSSLRLALKQSLQESGKGSSKERDRDKRRRDGSLRKKQRKRKLQKFRGSEEGSVSAYDEEEEEEEGSLDESISRSSVGQKSNRGAGDSASSRGSTASSMSGNEDGDGPPMSMDGVFESDISSDDNSLPRTRPNPDEKKHPTILKIEKKKLNSSVKKAQKHSKERSRSASSPTESLTKNEAKTEPLPQPSVAEHSSQNITKKSNLEGNSKGTGKSKKARTVPPPSADVETWIHQMSDKHQRRNIAVGLRVKVRFLTRVKRDGREIHKSKWYGGLVTAVLKNGKKIDIQYDDGTCEEATAFPDKDILVDDEGNGLHETQGNAFIPQLSDADSDSVSIPTSGKSKKREREAQPMESHLPSNVEGLRADVEGVKVGGSSRAESSHVDGGPDLLISGEKLCSPISELPHNQLNSNNLNDDRRNSKSKDSKLISTGSTALNRTEKDGTPEFVESISRGLESKSLLSEAIVLAELASVPSQTKSLPPTEPMIVSKVKSAPKKESKLEVQTNLRNGEEATKNSKESWATTNGKTKSTMTVNLPIKTPDLKEGHQEELESDSRELSHIQYLGIEKSNSERMTRESEEAPEENDSNGTDEDMEILIKRRVDVGPRKTQKRPSESSIEEDHIRKKKKSDRTTSKGSAETSLSLVSDSGTKVMRYDNSSVPTQKKGENSRELLSAETRKPKDGIPRVKINLRETSSSSQVETMKQAVNNKSKSIDSKTQVSLTNGVSEKKKKRRSEDKSLSPMTKKSNAHRIPRRQASPDTVLADQQISRKSVDTSKAISSKASSSISSMDSRPPKPTNSGGSDFERKHIHISNDDRKRESGTPRQSLKNSDDWLDAKTPPSAMSAKQQRSGRRAAQQANQRISEKKERVIDGYTKVKKRRKEHEQKTVPPIPSRKRPFDHDDEDDSYSYEDVEFKWVQCEKCEKWRVIPASIDDSDLPDQWFCEMNIYDPKRNFCEAPEQTEERCKKKGKAKRARQKRLREQQALGRPSRESLRQGRESVTQDSTSASFEDDDSQSVSRSIDNPKRLNSAYPQVKKGNTKSHRTDTEIDDVGHGNCVEPQENNTPEVNRSDDIVPDSVVPPLKVRPGRRPGRPPRANRDIDRNVDKGEAKKQGASQEWVQCEKCSKWRRLPADVSADDLPDVWYCTMNTWDPNTANCEAEEDKEEVHTAAKEISSVSNNNHIANSSKLSYYNLLFGTGKKHNRPGSERTRVSESLFADHTAVEQGCNPTLRYANSSAYIPRGSYNAKNESPECMSLFDLMQHSQLWNELHANAFMLKDATPSRKGGKHVEVGSEQKELVLEALGDGLLKGNDIVSRVQALSPSLYNKPVLCLDRIHNVLNQLVKDGKVEIVTRASEIGDALENLYRRRAQPDVSRRTRCIKISKPWKQNRVILEHR